MLCSKYLILKSFKIEIYFIPVQSQRFDLFDVRTSVVIKTKNCKIITKLHKKINRQIRVLTYSKKYHSIVTFKKTVVSAYIVFRNLDIYKGM